MLYFSTIKNPSMKGYISPVSFTYIRNRISEYKKDDLLEFCYSLLDNKDEKMQPIWSILTLMKWTLIYGEQKYPYKILTSEKFSILLNTIYHFNEEHISSYIKSKQVSKAFLILYTQQFYLQKTVYKEIFATQLKLFSSIKGKYSIEKSFEDKTGFSILDFLFIEQAVWLYINIKMLDEPDLYFDGYLDGHFLNLVASVTSIQKVRCYLNLLTLNPNNATESISKFKHKIKKEDLQTMEMSFYTMFPFAIYKNQIKLVHNTVFKHSVNYYIYDFLKSNDENFTTEFGYRLEKFIEYSLIEIGIKFSTEKQLKNILPSKSNLVDFLVEENIFIESKASELQAYPSVNPTDELIYNALKTSIFKAYFEQLVPVARQLNSGKENWGIIITYKELFWSDFKGLFEIGKDRYDINESYSHLPAENVFIIDIYTWNRVIQIVKDKKATLSDILKLAKENNSTPQTSKQLFDMHLDIYNLEKMKLNYLQEELKSLEIKEQVK